MTQDIASNINQVNSDIINMLEKANRPNNACKLVAVSKTFSTDHIIPALEAGQRIFGENKVQESKQKWPELKAKYEGVELHLIGPLQSNKAKEAVALFDVIETVDREKIAIALAKEMKKQERYPELFIQVNTGNEAQKSGIAPSALKDFIDFCKNECHLTISGLMCIPPFDEDPAPHFKLLKQLADQNNLPKISMGMSADYPIAIANGATHIRVGSGIFGARNYS